MSRRAVLADERDAQGYVVAYQREEIAFPVVVTAMIATGLIAGAFATVQPLLLVMGIAGAAAAYHNLPLLESGRPVLGANQYGIFIQGLGLIRWRACERIDLLAAAERAMVPDELSIVLGTTLESALVADWRRRPLHRALMRRPYRLVGSATIRIALAPLERQPADIHATLLRMWRHYRS